MKCRYDLSKKCTSKCNQIDTCAWLQDKNRRKKVFEETEKQEVQANGRKKGY